MAKIYFIVGSQDLYGEQVLETVKEDAQIMAMGMNKNLKMDDEIFFHSIVKCSSDCVRAMEDANNDKECVGVMVWCHTFSPAKMWIRGLQILHKPLCHLCTQFNEVLPYAKIDMDFMNLNQAAHGDRELGFIIRRLNIPSSIIVGFYLHKDVLNQIKQFIEVCNAIEFSRNLKVACFGNNMRQVAVTDGDRVESQIKYGWEVNYYPIGDLVSYINKVSSKDIDALFDVYKKKYTLRTDNIEAVKEQAKYELGIKKFLIDNDIKAFADTFQDLYGLKQLPGLSIQRLMHQGYGFGAEGDYKTAALHAVLNELGKYRKGATAFMEDYTYDLTIDKQVELGSHMLEVSESFSSGKPAIEVHPLGIGGKEDPARLVFEGITGPAVAVGMIDLGTHFRLVVANVELVKQIKPMPNLPVARLMWKILPNLQDGVKGWVDAGGGHHMVLSTAVTKEDIELFAKLTDTEVVFIGF